MEIYIKIFVKCLLSVIDLSEIEFLLLSNIKSCTLCAAKFAFQ